VGAYDEGEGEGVPVLVGVGGFVGAGVEGAPVASVVGGDVGAVGAYGDPGLGGGVVGYGGAKAVGWGGRGVPMLTAIFAPGRRTGTRIRFFVVPTNRNQELFACRDIREHTPGAKAP